VGHVTAFVNLAAVATAFFVDGQWHEDAVRVIGAAFQCIGIAGVVWGVLETRRQFGMPSLSSAVVAYFRRFPRLSLPVITGAVGAALGTATGQAHASVSRSLPANATLQQQIDYLIATVADLKNEDVQLRQYVDAKALDIKAAIERERAARGQETSHLRGLLISHATGGLNISLCGAIFLFVGVVLGTLPYSWF
jgi:hypothetical protein